MRDTSLLSPWVRRFLLEHLVGERNLARNTQMSYRDTLRQLLLFVVGNARKQIDCLHVEDLTPARIQAFLRDLESSRKWSVTTRNQRLAAIRSLAQFIGTRSPEHLQWCGTVRIIPLKKTTRPLITYLEKDEMDALLAAPDQRHSQGCRDHALLLFLYNTGARADEAAHVQIGDLRLGQVLDRDPSSVWVRGKGNKQRCCPLWAKTAIELLPLVRGRPPADHVFLNRRGQPLTRFGVHALVERYAADVAAVLPSVAMKRVSPHTIRHTTATHLLRAGVDVNTIRAWLGHVSLSTTNIYAEVDLEMKAKALATCEVDGRESQKRWREDKGLLAFLQNL